MGKYKEMMTDIQNLERDVKQLVETVEYLRGVIDGAPGEGHIKSIINGLDARLRNAETEDESIQEELVELQEIVRKMFEKVEKRMNMDAGVKQVPLEDVVGGNMGAIDELMKWKHQEVDNRLRSLEEKLNLDLLGIDGRVKKLEKLVETSLAGIRELEKEHTGIEEQISENLRKIRKLYLRVDLLEGVEDFHANRKIDSIGTAVKWENEYQKEFFHSMYASLTKSLGLKPLAMDELLATPTLDWPSKLTDDD